MSGVVQFVYADRPGLFEVDVEEVLKKREGNAIIIDWRVVRPADRMYLFPGLFEYDASSDSIVTAWGNYVEKDYPKLYPKFEIVESALDHLIIQRYDGQLFKITSNFVGEIAENVYVNAGKSLWDLIVLECMIEAKENPKFSEDKNYRKAFANKVVMVVGFLAYVCDLIELRFE